MIRILKTNALQKIAELAELGFVHDVEYGFIPESTRGTIIIRGTIPLKRYQEAQAIAEIIIFPDKGTIESFDLS